MNCIGENRIATLHHVFGNQFTNHEDRDDDERYIAQIGRYVFDINVGTQHCHLEWQCQRLKQTGNHEAFVRSRFREYVCREKVRKIWKNWVSKLLPQLIAPITFGNSKPDEKTKSKP